MKSLSYSWVICGTGTLILLCTNGFTANVMSIFLPFLEEAGYTGAQSSALISIRCFTAILGMLFVTKFYQRVSLRAGLTLFCALTGVAFGLMAVARSYGLYCLGASVAGIAYGLGTTIPVSLLITEWFCRHRATALGICSAGTGLSSMIFPPLVTYLAERYSLTLAFLSLTVISLLIALAAGLFLRNSPASCGLLPYGAGSADGAEEQAKKSRRRAPLPPGQQRLFLAAIVLFGGLTAGTSLHYSVLFTTCGHAKDSAALCISVFGLFLMLGKFVFGAAVDRFGAPRATLLFGVLLVAGCACCCLAGSGYGFMLAGSILMGFGFPPSSVGLSVWAEDFSTPEQYGSVLRNYQFAYTAGGMLLTAVPGMMYDATGSYVSFYAGSTLLFALFFAVVLLVYRGQDRRIERSAERSAREKSRLF